jgi:hypothetical protein
MRYATKVALICVSLGASLAAAYLAFMDDKRESVAPFPIPDSAVLGFEKCAASEEFRAVIDDLFAHGSPIAKEKGIWVYAVNGRFMDVEIRRLELGVCNASGERGCGWANYIGLGMNMPLDEVGQVLRNRSGIDFTEEQRDEEADATMRPILTSRTNSTGSVLFCDPGQL